MEPQSTHGNDTMLTGGQEASSSTTSTSVVGRKWGPSREATMLSNDEKRYVSTNDLGQQKGDDKNHHKFISTLRILTRTHIPIIYSKIINVHDEDIKSIMKGFEAVSACNSANRENLTAPVCVGRDSMVVVRHRLANEMILKSDAQVPRSDGFIKAHTKSDKIVQCPTLVEKIRKCERLNPESKMTSMTDFVAKSVDKDHKGHLIGLGAGVCPTLLKKAKHLLIQNEDLCDTNIELAGKVDSTSQGGSCSTSQPPSIPFQAPISALNPHLNKKCILNGFSKAKVAHGKVAFVDPAIPIH
ncbi:hypothetical protein GIB67_034343 [Kingdonia uniflora]|uniref:Uncharacterized protein n=1 Tax=Kingdonia uniflora TaxID=39325 RepID=A0A7J7NRY2_9MAGN|nr:hypothetical protein GIB67_034343 [Kingdonia uniflora]